MSANGADAGSVMAAECAAAQATARIVLLEHGRMPTTDYLVATWAERQGVAVARIDISRASPQEAPLENGDFVVIVRYLTQAWVRELERQRGALAGLAYFMDDDLWDAAALREIPLPYAGRIWARALRYRRRLEHLGAETWVASESLMRKYHASRPRSVPLAPSPAMLEHRSYFTYCYHGTASHSSEIRWLVQVVKAVQERLPSARFEIIGDRKTYRLYRDVARVSVLHPLTWANYLVHTAAVSYDVGLAPLLPGVFNAGRGPTKFFDFARMGAVGVYSDVEPYRGFIRNGADGLLVENKPDVWVRALEMLASAPSMRSKMAIAARERALEMAARGRDREDTR